MLGVTPFDDNQNSSATMIVMIISLQLSTIPTIFICILEINLIDYKLQVLEVNLLRTDAGFPIQMSYIISDSKRSIITIITIITIVQNYRCNNNIMHHDTFHQSTGCELIKLSHNGKFVFTLCTSKYTQIQHGYFIINCCNCKIEMSILDFYVSQDELHLTWFMVIFLENMIDLWKQWRNTTFITAITVYLHEALTAWKFTTCRNQSWY